MSLLPIASRESEQMAVEMEEDFSERENVFNNRFRQYINLSMMSLADSLPNNPSCFSERLEEGIQNV